MEEIISDNGQRERKTRRTTAFLKDDRFIMAFIYAAALALHILMTGAATIFNLTPDEYSVAAIAAYLNGYNWETTVSTGGYYGYFQSLFYVPVFWVTDDPYMQYRLMLVINGLLMSFVPVIVYRLARGEFRVGRPSALLFSLICGMYPSYMLLTKFTWNETMCCLLPWVFALVLYKSLGCKGAVRKQIFSVLGGLTLAAAYAAHGRMLALLAAGAVLELVVFFSMKKKIFCFTGFYGSIAAGFFIDRLIKRHFQSVLWNVGSGKSVPVNTLEKMLKQLFGENSRFSAERFFDTLIGHFFYFFSATWGFGAVCVIVIITAIVIFHRRRGKTPVLIESGFDPKTLPYINAKTAVFCWLSLLAMGAAFAVSVLFKSTSSVFDKRMDTVIYGRYTESFYPIAILCGLLLLYRGKVKTGHVLAALLLTVSVFAGTQLLVVPIVTNSETFVSAMVLGLAPMRYGEGLKSLYTQETFYKIYAAVAAALAVFLIIISIKKLGRARCVVFSAVLAGLLIYTSIFGYANYIVPQGRTALNAAKTMSKAVDKLGGEFGEITLFNVSRDKYVKTQFLYRDMTVRVASSVSAYNKLERKTDIVMAGYEETPELWIEDLRLIGSVGNAIHIYAASDSARDWAESRGFRLGESSIVRYSAAELPVTSAAVKTGHNESADLDFKNAAEDNVRIMLPQNAAVYTNYTNLQKGTYVFTVSGEGINRGIITLTSDRGKNELPFEILTNTGGKLQVAVSVYKKTENVRFKLTNSGSDASIVDSLEFRLMN